MGFHQVKGLTKLVTQNSKLNVKREWQETVKSIRELFPKYKHLFRKESEVIQA